MQHATIAEPVAINVQPQAERSIRCAKLRVLLSMFDISLRELANGSGRAISRSQVHRILHGKEPSALERRAVAAGLLACLGRRCDSAFLFE